MFRIDVLQNQWLMLALIAGSALILGVALVHLAMARPRQAQGDPTTPRGRLATLAAAMPWLLIVTFAGLAAFVVIYTFVMAGYPPNW